MKTNLHKNWEKELYMKYAEDMFRICYRYVNNEDEATIILNNAFLKVFKNYNNIIEYPEREKAWISKM